VEKAKKEDVIDRQNQNIRIDWGILLCEVRENVRALFFHIMGGKVYIRGRVQKEHRVRNNHRGEHCQKGGREIPTQRKGGGEIIDCATKGRVESSSHVQDVHTNEKWMLQPFFTRKQLLDKKRPCDSFHFRIQRGPILKLLGVRTDLCVIV